MYACLQVAVDGSAGLHGIADRDRAERDDVRRQAQ